MRTFWALRRLKIWLS